VEGLPVGQVLCAAALHPGEGFEAAGEGDRLGQLRRLTADGLGVQRRDLTDDPLQHDPIADQGVADQHQEVIVLGQRHQVGLQHWRVNGEVVGAQLCEQMRRTGCRGEHGQHKRFFRAADAQLTICAQPGPQRVVAPAHRLQCFLQHIHLQRTDQAQNHRLIERRRRGGGVASEEGEVAEGGVEGEHRAVLPSLVKDRRRGRGLWAGRDQLVEVARQSIDGVKLVEHPADRGADVHALLDEPEDVDQNQGADPQLQHILIPGQLLGSKPGDLTEDLAELIDGVRMRHVHWQAPEFDWRASISALSQVKSGVGRALQECGMVCTPISASSYQRSLSRPFYEHPSSQTLC
jgi:hypothetical protein